MGWDQDYSVESVSSFLQRLVGIEDDFVAKEVRRRMEAKGLEIVLVEDVKDESDGFYLAYPTPTLQRVTLSDGRVFIHKCVHTVSSDDWGRDDFELRDVREETTTTHESMLDWEEELDRNLSDD